MIHFLLRRSGLRLGQTTASPNKVYADNSAVAYSHTPGGKPTRTAWARGTWREQSYDASGLLSATAYGDGTPAVSYAYDPFRRLACASNAVAAYAYRNSDLGVATNETIAVSGTTNLLVRLQDALSRPAGLSLSNPDTPTPPYALTYSYDAENRLSAVSNAAFVATYAYTSDGRDAGYTLALTNGITISRTVLRDPYRRHLVAAVTNGVDGVPGATHGYAYDLLDRATRRVDGGTVTNTFGYNPRSEVVSATLSGTVAAYAYDPVGNRVAATNNAVATLYATNPLNQYTNILRASAPPRETFPAYDPDGNMVSNGVWSYTWDADNRLVTVASNSVLLVTNAYDHAHRRVLKVTPTATHTYLYDGWHLVQETVASVSGTATNHFVWGRDLSGSFQGAGGIGGLLAVALDSEWYFPFYDNNGNVTAYVDESGAVVAEYTYDAFGRTIEATGLHADTFRHRFSTKYLDVETGLYYYGYRFYSPEPGRWMSRDPIEEAGGLNLYGFVGNSMNGWDYLGLAKVEISSAVEQRASAADPTRIGDFLVVTVTVVEPPPTGSFLNFIQLKKTGGNEWAFDSKSPKSYPYYYDMLEIVTATRLSQEGTPLIEFADGPGGAQSSVTTQFYLAVVEVKRECVRPLRDPVTGTPLLIGALRHRVSVLKDLFWSYNMYRTPEILVGAESKASDGMIPTLRERLGNKTFLEPWFLPFSVVIAE